MGTVTWLLATIERKRKKIVKKIKKNLGQKDASLLIDIGGDPLEAQVTNWWAKEHGSVDAPLFIVRYESFLAYDELDKLLKEIRGKLSDISSQGIDKIHLFQKTSIAIASIIRGLMVNGCDVILYNMARDGNAMYQS